jgi:hypothetical protein
MSNEIPAILEPRDEAEIAKDLADYKARQIEFENQEKAIAAARKSALAKLAVLGLTADEIASLLTP